HPWRRRLRPGADPRREPRETSAPDPDRAPWLHGQAGWALGTPGPPVRFEGERVPVHAPDIRAPDLGVRTRVVLVMALEADLVAGPDVLPEIGLIPRVNLWVTADLPYLPASVVEPQGEMAPVPQRWRHLARACPGRSELALREGDLPGSLEAGRGAGDPPCGRSRRGAGHGAGRIACRLPHGRDLLDERLGRRVGVQRAVDGLHRRPQSGQVGRGRGDDLDPPVAQVGHRHQVVALV